MIKSEKGHVTIKTNDLFETFLETSLMLHAIRAWLVDEVGQTLADELLVNIGRLATLDEDDLIRVMDNLIDNMKGRTRDS